APTGRTPPEVKPEPPVANEDSATPEAVVSAAHEPRSPTIPSPEPNHEPAAGMETEPKTPARPERQDPAEAPQGVTAPPLDGLWRQLLEEVRSKRPLILSWLEKAVPLQIGNGVLRLGFPADQTLALESL